MTSSDSFYRPLVGPLFVPTFFIALLLAVAEPTLPLYLQNAGASYAVVGTVISALGIGRLLAVLPSGGVLTRFSMRHTMLAGLGILTAALSLMALVSSIPIMFACWLLAGVGLSLYELARHQFIAMRIANHNRGRSVAVVGGVFRFGNVVGPLIGGWAAQKAGFRAPFAVMAGLTVVTIVIVLFTVPGQPPPQTAFSLRAYLDDLRATWRDCRRILMAAGSGQMLMQVVRRARSVIIPLYAANMLGLDVAAVGMIIGVGSALDAILFLPAGWIVDKYGRKSAIIPSLILQAAGLLILPLAGSFAALVGAALLIGLGNGISAGTMLTLGADLAPADRRTAFLGLWRISNTMGFALGPNVVGTAATLLSLPLASVTAGFIGVLAAGLFSRFVPETLERQ